MRLKELVSNIMSYNGMAVRQWVMEANGGKLNWGAIPVPIDMDPTELAIAAGVVELLSERSGNVAPLWTANVPEAPEDVFLLKSVEKMPRLRALCESSSPEPLKRRRLYAPPDYLLAV